MTIAEGMTTESIADLEAELLAANHAHKKAVEATSAARNVECDALNRVNRIQKKIDEKLKLMRESAHRDTDWRAPSRRGSAL